MRASCSPQLSHFSLFIRNPCRYHNEFVCRSEFADDYDLTSIDSPPTDHILPFPSCLITLPLYDFSGEDRSLHVKYGQCIFIQFIQGVERHNVPAFTDSRPETFKDSWVQRV